MPDVTNNTSAEQFEISVDGSKALLQYGIDRGRMVIYHTEVPEAFRGRGYGDLLARTALDYAQEHSLKVQPLCPFVRAFIDRHPEYRR